MKPFGIKITAGERKQINPKLLPCTVTLSVHLHHFQIFEEALSDGIVMRITFCGK